MPDNDLSSYDLAYIKEACEGLARACINAFRNPAMHTHMDLAKVFANKVVEIYRDAYGRGKRWARGDIPIATQGDIDAIVKQINFLQGQLDIFNQELSSIRHAVTIIAPEKPAMIGDENDS